MHERVTDELPPEIARSIRLASVPAYVRALFARLPRIAIHGELPPDPLALNLTTRQLLKLASLGGRAEEVSLRVVPGPVRITLASGARRRTLSPAELEGDIQSLCRVVLEALFDAGELTRSLEAFAIESATLSSLQTLTRQMLVSKDLDHALYAMLSGITSGYGLAFNRAALFVHDEARGVFVGGKAIGPHDEDEAHRIWEEIEYDDKKFEHLLVDYVESKVDNRLESFVRGLELAQCASPDDEVTAALASTGPVLFTRARPTNPALETLGCAREFVLGAIQPHGELRALLLADNVYSGTPILPEQVSFLGFFLDQLALVWQNISLLRRVEQLARFDSLTGLYNRRAFEEKLREGQSRCVRHGAACALLVVDVDRFKEINDTRGHPAGDDVLRALGALFKGALRDHDVVARFGGDEFAILLPAVARDEAAAVARRLGVAAKARGISISVGGASWPDDCAEPSLLLARADESLYQAKRAGRGRACFGGSVPLEATF